MKNMPRIDWKARKKNVYFIVGIIGLLLSTLRIEPSTLTSWDKVLEALIAFFSNPYLIGTFMMALFGIIVDGSSPGMGDR